MKLLLYADPHWSVNSSIVRSRGEKYSTRLENLIETIDWVERTAEDYGCDSVICLGDFFDTAQLNSEEISALSEIGWSQCRHYFIAGNHEMGRANHTFSSANIFDLCPNSCAITYPTYLPIYDQKDTRIVCIPYILEKNRRPLAEYLAEMDRTLEVENVIILSHNDIAGIQMGGFLSNAGFTLEEIRQNCKLFVNGHLHNGEVVAPGVVNLGNITGQNFSEDGYRYKHQVMIIDTATHVVEFIDNPYAFKFYKLDFSTYDESKDSEIQRVLETLPGPAVITVKVQPRNEIFAKDLISTMDNIIESRVILDMGAVKIDQYPEAIKNLNKDHFSRFSSFVLANVGDSEIIREELINICGEAV